jgi:hypothetical protein
MSGPDTSAQFEGKPCGLERDGWTVKKQNMKLAASAAPLAEG